MTACANPDHAAAPADYCSGCAQACERELTALNDRYMRLLTSESDARRNTYAAARRTAWDDVHGVIGRWYWGGHLADLLPDHRPALYRATMIDPEAGRSANARHAITELNKVAARALIDWDQRIAQVTAEAKADPREAEITRLRALIVANGQRLHREFAEFPRCDICGATEHDRAAYCLGTIPPRPPGWTCGCPGCELIRDMDTAGLLEAAS